MNPLECRGTALPPAILLAAKLLALYLIVNEGFRLPSPYLPFLPFLDALRDAPIDLIRPFLRIAFYGCALLVLLNQRVRSACFFMGATILLAILLARTGYSNNRLFFGCFLLLIALQPRGGMPWLLRAQLILVYFGAGLNKLLDADWQSGQYMAFWSSEILHNEWYQAMAAALPAMMLHRLMSWLVIVTELGLAASFAVRRLWPVAIAVGLAFHIAMLAFTEGTVSWVFLYGMGASYLAFAPGSETDTGGEIADPFPLPYHVAVLLGVAAVVLFLQMLLQPW